MDDTDHEQIWHSLMAIIADTELVMRRARRLLSTGNPSKSAIEQIHQSAQDANDDVRRLCALLPPGLVPPQLPRSYVPKKDGSPRRRPAGRPISERLPREVRFPRITEADVLEMADRWFQTHGSWPTPHSGRISEDKPGTWSALDQALRLGLLGLPGGSSVARLIAANREVHRDLRRHKISAEQILLWADNWYQRTGNWPNLASGSIPESPGQTWQSVSKTLRRGVPGVGNGSSLARFLHKMRGVPIHGVRPPLTVEMILEWAIRHYERTGEWPKAGSGDVLDAPGETWANIDSALLCGHRTLPKQRSLATLLAIHRGIKNRSIKLDLMCINAWVLQHFQTHGRLPRVQDGLIPGAGGETWAAIDNAFRTGCRGLANSGIKSLKGFLQTRFPRPEFGQFAYRRPRLTAQQIVAWADEHYERTGTWPRVQSGAIPGSDGETWNAVAHALYRAQRGLTSRTSLEAFLCKHRDIRPTCGPPLTEADVLRFADEYYRANGKWPTKQTRDPVPGAKHETWQAIDACLHQNSRGLENGGSLALFLHKHRGARHRLHLPDLTLPQIEAWARSYRRAHGHWPSFYYGGTVQEAPGETWRAIYAAFRFGRRGLGDTGYTSLGEFLRSL